MNSNYGNNTMTPVCVRHGLYRGDQKDQKRINRMKNIKLPILCHQNQTTRNYYIIDMRPFPFLTQEKIYITLYCISCGLIHRPSISKRN